MPVHKGYLPVYFKDMGYLVAPIQASTLWPEFTSKYSMSFMYNTHCMYDSSEDSCEPESSLLNYMKFHIFVWWLIELRSTVLFCQPRVTMTTCFVIRDLESIDHLFINPIRRIGLIHKRSLDSR